MAKIAPSEAPLAPKEPAVDMGVIETIKKEKSPTRPENVEKAKNDLRRIIQQVGIDPQRVIMAGQYAEQALKNPSMYPMAIQMAIKENLISPNDVQSGGIDYKLLANGITAGRLTAELVKEGKL